MTQALRDRIRGGDVVLGTFLKSASYQVAEVLGHAGLDFVVIDAEHAPFGIATIDQVMLGAKSVDLPCLVRPPDLAQSFVGQCLDLGASGILAPHITDAKAASQTILSARYQGGQRGFSPSTRAGRFGTIPGADYRENADRSCSLWLQIEDAQALEHLDAIAAVENVDCLFVGRADLALSLGVKDQNDPRMRAAIVAVAEAACRHSIAFGLYTADPGEIAPLLALGATVLICGSDQSLLMSQGRSIRQSLAHAMRDATQ